MYSNENNRLSNKRFPLVEGELIYENDIEFIRFRNGHVYELKKVEHAVYRHAITIKETDLNTEYYITLDAKYPQNLIEKLFIKTDSTFDIQIIINNVVQFEYLSVNGYEEFSPNIMFFKNQAVKVRLQNINSDDLIHIEAQIAYTL